MQYKGTVPYDPFIMADGMAEVSQRDAVTTPRGDPPTGDPEVQVPLSLPDPDPTYYLLGTSSPDALTP